MSELEHSVRVLAIDEKLQESVNDMVKEGWALVPGVQPVAIYHVFRQKGIPAPLQGAGGMAKMSIDDSKIQVMRDGKIVN